MKIKLNCRSNGFVNNWRLMLLAAVCAFIFSTPVAAQPEKPACRTDCQCSSRPNAAVTELRIGETLQRRFEPGQSAAHTYQIKLPAARFGRVRIEQNGIDVFGCLCESQQKVDAFGVSGAEEFSFASDGEKLYSFTIQPFAAAESGDYTVSIAEWRTAAATDVKLIEAESLWREAGLLRDENCPAALAKYQAAREKYEQLVCADCLLRRAEIIYRIGGYAASSGKHAAAANYFEQSLKLIAGQPPTDLRNLERQWLALTDLGLAMSRLGNFPVARQKLERAISLIKSHLSPDLQPDYARLLNIYANLLLETGEPSLALAAVEEGLSNNPGENLRAALLLNKGLASDALGDAFAALDLYAEALKLSQNQTDRARMLINSAVIRERFGELDAARTNYEAALQIGKSANLAEAQAHALRSLGVFCLNSFGTAKINEARDKLTAAVQMFEELENPFEVEKTKIYLATIFYREKRFDEAARIYRTAKEKLDCESSKAIEPQQIFLCGLVFNNAAAVFYEQRDIEHARADFSAALKLRRAASDISGQAETNYNLAVMEMRNPVPNQSAMFDYFKTARAFYRQIRDRRGESAVLYEMALAAQSQSKAEAADYLRAALVNSSEISRDLEADDLRLGANATAADYWKLYLALTMGQKGATSPNFGLLLSERARAQSLRQNLEKANVQLEGENLPECRTLAADKELYTKTLRRRAAKEEVLKNTRLSEIQAGAVRSEIDAIDEETARMTRKLKSGCPRFANFAFSTLPDAGSDMEVGKLQALLDDKAAVLEYSLGTESSYLWVVTNQSINHYRLPNRKVIEQQTRLVREMLTNKERFFQPLDPAYQAAVKKLSALVLPAAVLKLMPTQTRLTVIADGELLNLPFAILPLAPSGTLLVEKFEVGYLPSLLVLEELREQRGLMKPEKRERRLALFSSPVFAVTDNGFPAEKKALMSADAGKNSFPTFKPLYFVRENDCRLVDIFLDSRTAAGTAAPSKCACAGAVPCGAEGKLLWRRVREATRRNFVAAQLADFTDIILLTHGIYNAEKSSTGAEQSGLYFSYFAENGEPLGPEDYLLRPNDIYNLHLKSSLVTLGACETSLGAVREGEGLLNLTRGFIWAGARGVTATLWSVEEEATMNAVLQMNRAMLKEDLSPGAALRKAQLAAMKNNADPRRWAGIVYYGDWKTGW